MSPQPPEPPVEKRCDSCVYSVVGPCAIGTVVRFCYYEPPIPIQYPSQPGGGQWGHSLHPQVKDDDWCWQHRGII